MRSCTVTEINKVFGRESPNILEKNGSASRDHSQLDSQSTFFNILYLAVHSVGLREEKVGLRHARKGQGVGVDRELEMKVRN